MHLTTPVSILLSTLSVATSCQAQLTHKKPLRVESFVNSGPSLDVVSSLIIGSEAAVLIDMPLAIPQAENLAAWVNRTTDKPLVAVFTTHSHPDHYLSGAALLPYFPDAKYYAHPNAVALIQNESQQQIAAWGSILGNETVVSEAIIPTPYNFTFFTLPGNEDSPIQLLSPLGGDTIDETLFYIPSIQTLIAGDTVYSHDMHLWLADLLTPALTSSWLSTLEYIKSLAPKRVIPGHALSIGKFGPMIDVAHTEAYVKFFQQNIEARGVDYFIPKQIFDQLDAKFPGLLNKTSSTTSATLLNITAEEFGKNGTRRTHYVDLASFNDTRALTGWQL
ncbi:hypothetical protein CKM354_000219000 [Cercospora kikuchii]|uniref:Metallo-beta-lactamase domain-containing protein n=1 Tax=Cercospora kikuchii TaxID=84275 RepID=A0A9P3FDG7_9PEZI|nr:uncharacterized protein CKM354_000219000 [Cercospora kikuchii]GIZ38789.1 hypothetical protein CKM354_000219000 [Cercospora kikuchii]